MNCPFCKPTQLNIILENDLAYGFYDKYPVQRGHVLIIPKQHIETYFEASDQQIMAIHRLIREAKEMVNEEFSPDGYNIGVNIGNAGGQTVPHLHVHLIPRYKGDVEDPRGGIRHAVPNLVQYPPLEG